MDDPRAHDISERRDHVVQQRRRERLPVLVVVELLEERLPHGLHDRTVDLPVEYHPVHHDPAVVHDGEVVHTHHPGGGIHLHDRSRRRGGVGGGHVHLAALIGEGTRVARVVTHDDRQPRIHARRQQEGVEVRRGGDLGERDRRLPVAEDAVGDLDPVGGCVQHSGGDGDHLVAHLAGGLDDRSPAHHHRTAAPRPAAVGQDTGVAVADHDIVGADTQFVRGRLGEDGLVALTLGLGADDHVHLAVRLHGEHGHLVDAELPRQTVNVRRRGLHHLRDPHPDETVLRPRLVTPAAGGLVVRRLEQIRELVVEAAAVQHGAGGGHIGPLLVGDHVHPAHRHRIDAELLAHQVQNPLYQEDGLRLAVAAVGAHRRLVGRHAAQFEVVVLQVVTVGHDGRGDDGGPRSQDVELRRADVGDDLGAQPQNPSVVAVRSLHIVNLLARVHAGGEALGAVLPPDDRMADPHRQHRHQRLLAHHVDLVPEAASHVGRHDSDVRLAQSGDLRQHGAQKMRDLCRGVQYQATRGGVELAERPVAVQRQTDDAVVRKALPQHAVRVGERRLGVAVGPRYVQEDVVTPVLVELRCVGLQPRRDVADRGQFLVVHLDEFEGVLGDVAAVGHHGGDRLAHETHLVDGEHRPGDLAQCRDHRQVVVEGAGVGRQFGPGERPDHAGQGHGARDVHVADAGVGQRAPQDGDVLQVGPPDITQIFALTAKEPGVLAAPGSRVRPRRRLGRRDDAHDCASAVPARASSASMMLT